MDLGRNFTQRRLSVSDFFTCSPIQPPPSYEVAIRIPSIHGQPPPAFTPTPTTPQTEEPLHNGAGHARPV